MPLFTSPMQSNKLKYRVTKRLPNRSQRGVALLTILLLVVVITVVAGAMMANQRIILRQYELLVTQDQLLNDIKAGEQLAVELIRADAQVADTDSLQDAWAQPIPTYPMEQHQVTLNIRDEASRFNLNNLYHDGAIDETAIGVFERLLSQLGLDPSLAYAVADWQDPDNTLITGDGDESVLYGGAKDPFSDNSATVIANQPFLSVDALVDIDGFNIESVALLRPYVTAIPYYLPINVNTANPLLLNALTEQSEDNNLGLSSNNYDINNTSKDRQIYTSVDEFMKTLPETATDSGAQSDSETDGNDDTGTQSDSSSNSESESDTTQSDDDKPNKPSESRSALAKLLSIDSQAFGVLIDVTVDDKHRYATSYVSKLKLNNTGDNTSDSQGSQQGMGLQGGMQSDIQGNTQPRHIQAFGTRLWSYRPAFE